MKRSPELPAFIKMVLFFTILFFPGELHIFFHGETNAGAWAQDGPVVFSTWEGFEVDKCASIWLIERFIAPGARIRFFPKGEPIREGISFDTPDARFKRSGTLSTFEALLRHYELKDPKLQSIAAIIHDAEINTWGRKAFDTTPRLQDCIAGIMNDAKNNEEVVGKTISLFDRLYEESVLMPCS